MGSISDVLLKHDQYVFHRGWGQELPKDQYGRSTLENLYHYRVSLKPSLVLGYSWIAKWNSHVGFQSKANVKIRGKFLNEVV